MIKSFVTGIRLATGSWKMILLLLSANILFSIPLALLVFLLVTQTVGGTIFVQRMYGDKLDAAWALDLVNDRFAVWKLWHFVLAAIQIRHGRIGPQFQLVQLPDNLAIITWRDEVRRRLIKLIQSSG